QGIKHRLGYFSETFIASRPGLLLMQMWIAHFGMRIQVIKTLIATIQGKIDAALQADTAGTGAPSGFEVIPLEVVQAQIWTQEALCYFLTNQVSLAVPLARQAVEMLPENWQFIRGTAMVYYGLSYFMQGQYSQAVEELKQRYENLQEPANTYGARLLFTRSVIYLLNGDLELCRQTAEQVLHDAFNNNLLLNQGWGCYLLGRVYQEWNQLELAADYYLQGVELRFTSNIMPALECIAGYAYILQILDRGEQAQQFLNSLEQLHGEQVNVKPPMFMALSAWMNLENGNPEEAQRWAEAFNAPVADQAIVWYHLPHLYKVKILMENNKPGSYQAIDNLLDEIQALAERTHNTFTLVRVLALRTAWLARCGKTLEAQQTLERALRLGRPGWFIHAFVKQGPELLGLLHAALRRHIDIPDIDEYIAAILAAFFVTGEARIAAKDRSSIKTLLTEREMEVLEQLSERLSINEIASHLSISPRTVQQHTHHIYRKLNVTNKREAVVAAIDLGILTTRQ
ncbi:MAG TPA: LuxR C-terminal-related transcriptional regulator, partial [Anaerolineales bacterium]|nr:LuxR C-terminal-related transcriptional regulator [Anaerolineales bacterium]